MQHNHLLSPLALSLTGVVLLSLPLVATQAAEDSYVSGMSYASLDVQGDDADTQQASVTGSVGIGKYFWIQGSGGKITASNSDDVLGDLRQIGVAAGLSGERLHGSVHVGRTRNDGSYQQRDVSASLDWQDTAFTIGIDLLSRQTDQSSDSTRSFSRLGLSNVNLHIDETLSGTGVGAHLNVNVSDALSLNISGMSYSYSSNYTLTSSNYPNFVNLIRNTLDKHPTLAETFYLNNSQLTRSIALLDSSYSVGASYQWSIASLSLDYSLDKALDSDSKTQTWMLGAAFFAGDHWMISPLVGQSTPDEVEPVLFAGLSVSYNW